MFVHCRCTNSWSPTSEPVRDPLSAALVLRTGAHRDDGVFSGSRSTFANRAEALRCWCSRSSTVTTAVRGTHLTRIDVGVTPAIRATESARALSRTSNCRC